ncbi:hypothetical protein QN351_18830, partial [Cryobacterium sp. 10C2]|uniref:hypothetical protein n=1 Tax=Cryobacterium sp. 10C2 TaxID=3048576 RepID=UPI002B232257
MQFIDDERTYRETLHRRKWSSAQIDAPTTPASRSPPWRPDHYYAQAIRRWILARAGPGRAGKFIPKACSKKQGKTTMPKKVKWLESPEAQDYPSAADYLHL